jgi:hypothetical protein
MLNAKVEEREEKQVVSLQPTWTQEPRNSMRHTSGPCINSEDCNCYMGGLRDRL